MGRAKYPLIPGHEWAGVVENTGDGVATQVDADVIVNTTDQDLLATVKDMAQERGVDDVIEASGSVALAAMASSLTKNAGVINTLGIYTTKVPEFDLADTDRIKVMLYPEGLD